MPDQGLVVVVMFVVRCCVDAVVVPEPLLFEVDVMLCCSAVRLS